MGDIVKIVSAALVTAVIAYFCDQIPTKLESSDTKITSNFSKATITSVVRSQKLITGEIKETIPVSCAVYIKNKFCGFDCLARDEKQEGKADILASVSVGIDLAEISEDDIEIDEKSKTVRIKIPNLKILKVSIENIYHTSMPNTPNKELIKELRNIKAANKIARESESVKKEMKNFKVSTKRTVIDIVRRLTGKNYQVYAATRKEP